MVLLILFSACHHSVSSQGLPSPEQKADSRHCPLKYRRPRKALKPMCQWFRHILFPCPSERNRIPSAGLTVRQSPRTGLCIVQNSLSWLHQALMCFFWRYSISAGFLLQSMGRFVPLQSCLLGSEQLTIVDFCPFVFEERPNRIHIIPIALLIESPHIGKDQPIGITFLGFNMNYRWQI